MTITQWYDEAWWKRIKRMSNNKPVWRAWTTDSCINSIEIPKEASLSNEKVIRTSYIDQPDCVEYFEFLERTNRSKLEEEVHNGLKHLFENNGITTSIKIPKATKTIVKVWPAAWYYQERGSPYTNEDITTWATNPIEGENVGLVSDAYYIQRTCWTEGAVLSAIELFRAQYNVNELTYPALVNVNLPPLQTASPCQHCKGGR